MRGSSENMHPTHAPRAHAATAEALEVYDEVAYCYDGTLEGLLSAIFAAYANHENPTDLMPAHAVQLRLTQRVSHIETNLEHARRVRHTLCDRCGWAAFDAIRKASLSSRPDAATAAYRFVRYALDEHPARACAQCRKRDTCPSARPKGSCPHRRSRAWSDITHPAVEPLFKIARSVDQECEHMRQFIRFEHLCDENAQVSFWFARCNPRDSVIPLVMGHFVERFNVQPFIIYDENHDLAGVYEGHRWYLVNTSGDNASDLHLPPRAAEEELTQRAWKRFYHTVAVESRYNPELRRHFMPKRFWKNLTEMQEDNPALARATP